MDTTSVCTQLASVLEARGWMMVTAESCTGGMIAAQCTDLSGSSRWFERGFVTYSNAAKSELIGVPEALITQHGAVSEPVALAMAQGAVQHAHAQVSVAVTGVAGPTGGTPDKPVGTVWFAWCIDDRLSSERCVFADDRRTVREATVAHALQGLLSRLP